MIGPTCPKCQRIHCGRDVVALPKFGGIRGYRVAATGDIYPTRAEAEAALCDKRSGKAS